MRICSFFASATELLFALGVGRSVIGRSEHCDYPPAARRLPVIVRSRITSQRLSSRAIDQAVADLQAQGAHQYRINVALLRRLRPDLVVTQELCSVCAASHPEILEALAQLPRMPRTVGFSPRRLSELSAAITTVGRAVHRSAAAQALNRRMHQELSAIARRVRTVRRRPRVWCAEWLDPLMAGGHWVPELVAMAGGTDGLGRAGENSERFSWDQIRSYDPEVIIVMPCSFTIARTIKEFPLLTRLPGWTQISAVTSKRVFAVDGAYFHRPGPRLVTGLRIMAALFHPDLFPKPPVSQARRLQ